MRAILIILIFLSACVEPYPLPEIKSNSQILVVDGFLNATDQVATVRLSRTVNLTSIDNSAPETGANVWIEAENGAKTMLKEVSGGQYEEKVEVSVSNRYRIVIDTRGEKYNSEFEKVGLSPPIDSISWKPNEFGISVFVSTNDPINKTQYFKWDYEETWEYTAAFQSSFIFNRGRYIYRLPENDIFHCWHTFPSTEILISTTNRLNQDVISEFQLLELPLRTEKLWIKYSILVTQRAISFKAYEYWQQLKKNTESLGTLFDPQPSQIIGNIASEKGNEVLGYFTASTVTTKRLTLALEDLPESYQFIPDIGLCEEDTVMLADLPKFSGEKNNLVVGVYNTFGVLIGFRYSTHFCTDCVLQGGTRQKPDYW